VKIFTCDNCENTVLFENTQCVKCGLSLAFRPEALAMTSMESQDAKWRALGREGKESRFCANWELNGCNWLVDESGDETYCRACLHNRTVPNLRDPVSQARWMKIEQAKKRLIYSLLRLRLPLQTPRSALNEPLMFDFLDDPDGSHEAKNVTTGHDNGLITLAISEADDAIREKNRTHLGEPYRTLLGHFRHEVGHYYWDLLVRDQGGLDAFRELFGDETADYARALEEYYAAGAPPTWNDRFVSAYASSHPWEDFAETFAHYLHIVDTLDTARAVGLHSDKPRPGEIDVDFDPYQADETQKLVDLWIAVAFAANCLNRSMGQPDLYPFVLSDQTIRKLGFIHALVRESSSK
jgi:hypothetical protein